MRKALACHVAFGILWLTSGTSPGANETTVASAAGPVARTINLNVYAAASLSDVLTELAAGYEIQTGDKLVFNFSASSTLERQIEEGAPADVFFSADEAKMDALDQRGLLVPGTRNSLLSNALVIVVPGDASSPWVSAFTLTNAAIARIALAEPGSVPAGIYAKQYLTGLGLWNRLAGKHVPTENVRAALAAVESGNADAGIVYKTDARISQKVRVAYEVPVAEGPKISYPVAILRDSRAVDAAKRYLRYLESEPALHVFRKYGFLINAGPH